MPKGRLGVNNRERGEIAQSSQSKGKEIMSVELSGETPPKTKRVAPVIRSSSFL